MMKINRVRASAGMNSTCGAACRRGAVGAVAVVLASSALALAGCGSSSSSSSTGATPGSSQTANSNKAAQFSQCMRAHGVPDFPDQNANGSFDLKVLKGSDLDPRSPAFQSAEQACKSLRPAGFGPGGAPSLASQTKTLQFVSCMRSHGEPNFPDPGSNGAFQISSSSGLDPNSPAFKSAMQSCRKLLPGGANGVAAQGG